MPSRQAPRQEVLNVLLAQLLEKRGVIAAPEQILQTPLHARKMPDVLVDFQGLRLVIEAEFSTTGGKKRAYEKARERVETAVAHIAVAVVYPAKLRESKFARLEKDLETAKLRYVIVTETILEPSQQLLYSKEGVPEFYTGSINELESSLRRCYGDLVLDKTLEKAVEELRASIDSFATAVWTKRGVLGKLAKALSVEQALAKGSNRKTLDQRRTALIRVVALILANAMIYQQVLSEKDADVRSLDSAIRDDNLLHSLLDEWQLILKINYYPIFSIANNLLSCLSSGVDVQRGLKELMRASLRIVEKRASLRHDLAGRIYHRLLEEAKYLGAYYTSIPAATLLLKLALQPERLSREWSSEDDLNELRIADLACGTGTLLMASADVVVDNYVRACAERGSIPELKRTQPSLIENVIYGYDVLHSAVHLTASTLTLRMPETPIDDTHLYSLPLGGPENKLGSLDFLRRESVTGTLFGKAEQIKGKELAETAHASIPRLDLCVMNPPFTRSVGGNLLFGNLGERERKKLQAELRRIVKSQKLPANITAGLGSVFVALGDMHLKRGGRMALVLPRALLSGVAWKPTRDLFAKGYQLEYLIVSHEVTHWNFSENTQLSEVLLIARKRDEGEEETQGQVVCVNLWKQPQTAIEALNIARSVTDQDPPDLATGRGAATVTVGDSKYGEAASVPWLELRYDSWMYPCSFAQVELNKALCHLRKGEVYLPREGLCGQVPLCPLEELGELGFDCRDMHDGFRVSRGTTAYPAFWNHDTKTVTTIRQQPNAWLEPLTKAKKGRPLREATHLWKKAGRVLLAERLWLNTMRLCAVRGKQKVLSNVWWPFALARCDNIKIEEAEKLLVFWLNSTLGILLLVGEREETRGAWVKFKKPVLHRMRVLDVNNLRKRVQRKLLEGYDRLASESLQSLPGIESDSIRAEIDRTIAEALGIPDFGILRELLAREPIISLDPEKLLPD